METNKCAFFKEEVKKIFESISSKTIFYVHPTVKMIKEKSEENFAACSITCEDVANKVSDVDSLAALLQAKNETHFIAVNINATDPKEPNYLFESYEEYLCKPWESEQPPRVVVMRCVADIEEHYNFLKKTNQKSNWKSHINNEAGVRYVFGNMIIDMLCRYFKYKITLEESDSVENAALNTSSGSKYDYVVWRLMLTEKDKERNVPIVVLETKHENTLTLKAAAQAISYYPRSRQGIDNFTGVAFLLNEWNGNVEFRIILFPYYCDTFGAQAVLLPTIKRNFEEFLKGDVIKLICTVCVYCLQLKLFKSLYLNHLIW